MKHNGVILKKFSIMARRGTPMLGTASRTHLRGRPLGAAAILALLAGAHLAFPAEPQAQAAQAKADPQEEIKLLRQEMKALEQSPDAPPEWQELQAVTGKLNEIEAQKTKEVRPLRERFDELGGTEAARKWRERIQAVSQRLVRLIEEENGRTREAGRKLFEARHQELTTLAPADTPAARQLGFDVLSYPRVDGSTSGHPLAVLIACRCLGAHYEWFGRSQARSSNRRGGFIGGGFEGGGPLVSGSREWEPEFYLLEYTLQARSAGPAPDRLAVIINRLLTTNAATHEAYVNLIEGRSDIGLLARPPSPDELNLAREKNVALDAVACALDAFVFLVHQDNPVTNLTTAQIRDIYTGKIKGWREVGGRDAEITAYQREANSGSQELMRDRVMKDLPFAVPADSPGAPRLIQQGMGGPYLALRGNKHGLAYSVYYYEHFMAGSSYTRVLAVDGVEPSFETIRARKYPYTAAVLVVTRSDLDPAAPAARWRAWLLTAEGQAVVRESGYVPVVATKP
jgi:ABC-type phosphate transport system substrate-binding protein